MLTSSWATSTILTVSSIVISSHIANRPYRFPSRPGLPGWLNCIYFLLYEATSLVLTQSSS